MARQLRSAIWGEGEGDGRGEALNNVGWFVTGSYFDFFRNRTSYISMTWRTTITPWFRVYLENDH